MPSSRKRTSDRSSSRSKRRASAPLRVPSPPPTRTASRSVTRATSVAQHSQPPSVVQNPQPTSVTQNPRPTSVAQNPQPTSVAQNPQPTSVAQIIPPPYVVQNIPPTSVTQITPPPLLVQNPMHVAHNQPPPSTEHRAPTIQPTSANTTDTNTQQALVNQVIENVQSSLFEIIKDTVQVSVDKALNHNTTRNEGSLSLGLPGQSEVVVHEALSISSSANSGTLPINIGVQNISDKPLPLSSSFPIDIRVPDSVKQKIWANEYVELSQLLKPQEWDQYDISMSNINNGPSLCLKPKRHSKLNSIDQWISAFNIYMSIYISKYTDQSKSMIKYIEMIRSISKNGGDFISFDEDVRYLRQSEPSPWDTFHSQLYVDSLLKHKLKNTNVQVSNQKQTMFVPKGHCFAYHRGDGCSGCQFSHRCPQCKGFHQVSTCRSYVKSFTPQFSGVRNQRFTNNQRFSNPYRFNNNQNNDYFRPRFQGIRNSGPSRFPNSRFANNSDKRYSPKRDASSRR